MGKSSHFIIGTLIGTAIGLFTSYLFAPAHRSDLSPAYRSRLDRAFDEGRAAAAAQEAEMLSKFEATKRAHKPGGDTG